MLPSRTLIVTGTDAVDVRGAFMIEAIGDTVFTNISGRIDGYSGVTLKEGRAWYVNELTSITLASGSVIVYFL